MPPSPPRPERPPPVVAAAARVLAPLARLLAGRGVGFGAASDLLKSLFVDAAARRLAEDGERVTDSRISVLTGLQRRDVKQLRSRLDEGAPPPLASGLLARALGRWAGAEPYRDAAGAPLALPRAADGEEASFERLCREVSQDVHPRSILDALVSIGAVSFDRERDEVTLLSPAVVGAGDDVALDYLGANVGDHAAAAVANLLAGPGAPPFFERAVHYNNLTPASVAELDRMAREQAMAMLLALNAAAQRLQDADEGRPDARMRFRAGAYVYADAEADDRSDLESKAGDDE